MAKYFTFNNQNNGEMLNLLHLNSITRKFGTNTLILIDIHGNPQLIYYGSSQRELTEDLENLKKDRIVLLDEKILIPENIFLIKPDDSRTNTLVIQYNSFFKEEVQYGSQRDQFVKDLENYRDYLNKQNQQIIIN